MNRLIEFVNKHISPFATKLSRNIWISSLQDSIIVTLPLTLVGSMISVLSILNEFIPGLPDLYPISTFSFGLIGLAIAFVLPMNIMQRKGMDSKKALAAIANMGVYLMLLTPNYSEAGEIMFSLDGLGTGGMFLGILSGFFTAWVFILFEKFSFFKNNETIPEYIVSSFDSFLPILISLFTSYVVIFVFNVNFFELLTSALMPLTQFGQGYLGLLSYVLITTILYSFGISPWLLYGLFYTIQLDGIAQNAALLAQGLEPLYIHSGEVVQAFITIGGMGTTLPLAFLLLKSKSRRLNAIGKAGIVPSLLNINEPIVFGAPIMLNPLLMIPFWLNSFIAPTIVYFTLNLGLVSIPAKLFNFWFIPTPFQAFLVNNDFRSVILVAVVLLVSTLIWYPFWKAYDQQQVLSEAEKASN